MADEQANEQSRGLNENLEAEQLGSEAEEEKKEGLENQESEDDDKEKENNQDGEENKYYGSPETYDFTSLELPEGFQIDKDLSEKFAPIGKELNLSQEGANKLANLLVEVQQKQVEDSKKPEVIAEYRKQEKQAQLIEYQKLLNNDAELGANDKDKYNSYLDVADKGYSSFGSDELKKLFSEKGLNYHPAVIKHFYRLGKLTGQDSIVNANNPVGQGESAAQILYGNSMANTNK